jgi:thioredoxin-like negative regulator of GroEL
MRDLTDQQEFEQLIGLGDAPSFYVPELTIIYFTADWCGACRSLDLPSLENMSDNVLWLKCNVDTNNYTPGYCNVKSIPTFLAIANKSVIGMLQHNKTSKVQEWVQNLYQINYSQKN